jgi:hypothetical protein
MSENKKLTTNFGDGPGQSERDDSGSGPMLLQDVWSS